MQGEPQAGSTGFAPFPEDTKYFGDGGKRWMINFCGRNLDRVMAQPRATGVAVELDREPYPNGRFARL